MKKTKLSEKKVKDLVEYALKLGIKRPSRTRKEDLISEIIAAEKVKKFSSRSKKIPIDSKKISLNKKKVSNGNSLTKKIKPSPAEKKPIVSSVFQLPFEHKFETPSHPQPVGDSSPYEHLGELPESYGTGKLFLIARDPYWLYAYWDYTWHQLEEMRRQAHHGELKLRVYEGKGFQGNPCQEITLNPAAKNWCIQVDKASTDFCVEFGYDDQNKQFHTTSCSGSTRTPSDRVSDRTDTRFVTIPFHLSFRELYEMVKAHFKGEEELADVLYRLQMAGFPFPFDYEKTPHLGQDLENLFGEDLLVRIRMGSEVISQWFRRRLMEESSSFLSMPR